MEHGYRHLKRYLCEFDFQNAVLLEEFEENGITLK